MHGRSLAVVVAAFTVLAVSSGCSSSTTDTDPCAGKGSYKGEETCANLGVPFLAKCGAASFDCAKLLEPECTPAKTFCKPGVDKAVADLNAAADCDGVKEVSFAYTCF